MINGTEKYDNSKFYAAYTLWLVNENKHSWDTMWFEVNNCLMSQAKLKAKGIRIPDLEGRIMDATIKAMDKIQKDKPDIKNLTNWLYFFMIDGIYNRKLQKIDREISWEAWQAYQYAEENKG